jgi:predicted acetyltransferase
VVEVRTVTEYEVPDVQLLVDAAFGGDPDTDEMVTWRPLVETGRTIGAYDAGSMVGSAGAFTFDMTVPGGPVPAAGVTGVGVLSTHRRQGVLRALMTHQLGEIRDRGAEAFAALWASEATIYPRFGYGVASRRWAVTVGDHDPALLGAAPTGRCRLVDAEEAKAACPAVYDAVRPDRPGMISRSPSRWTTRLRDLAAHRGGAGARKHVLYERAGEVRGYAWFRTKASFEDGRPAGQLRVVELVALDADAHGGLWRYLLGVDLMRSVFWDNMPGDDPVFQRLRDPRTVKVTVADGLYVRVLDPARALAERSYAAPLRAVIDVVDGAGGWAAGRWLLDASPDGATCAPTTESADLTLGAEELGAALLGDTTLRSLYGAGRVDEHSPGAVERASRAFSWDVAAWCAEIF